MDNQMDLTQGRIWRSLILFAIPILISNFFQQLYNTMDTVIIGHFMGDTSLAAIGASAAVYELLVGFAMGIGNGMSIVVARYFGSKNETMLKRSVAGTIIIGAVIVVVMMLATTFGMKPLLHLLDTPESIFDEAYSYIHILTMFVIVMFAYNLCSGLLRAVGNSLMALVFLMIASVINIVLDIVLITQLQMGIAGAAVATVIAQAVSVVMCLIYIAKKAKLLVPAKMHFKPDRSLYIELTGQGLSMAFMLTLVNSGTAILQRSINHLGDVLIAAHVTARKIFMFVLMPCATMSSTMPTFVSQNYGAGRFDRIKEGVRVGCKMMAVYTVVISIAMWLTAKPLVGLISGSSDPELLANATRYLYFCPPFFVVLGALFILRTSLQGLGQKTLPVISSIIELIGKILFAWLLIPKLGYTGVIICEPLIWCAMLTQLFFAYRKISTEFLRNSVDILS